MDKTNEKLMWKDKEINVGKVIIGTTKIVEFEYDDNIEVKRNRWGNPEIQTSCGCTSATLRTDKKKLIVKFTPHKIPKHLENEGKEFYSTTKKITIIYTDLNTNQEHEDILKFTAEVIKK